MKKIIKQFFQSFGYEILRYHPLDLKIYEDHYTEDSLKNRRFYNIGAGAFSHPYWTNIDYFSDWYSSNHKYTEKGIQHDLFSLKPIPVDTATAEIVYSSHTVEHINDEAAFYMFKEAYRMLKEGGVFRLTMPNIDLLYRAYCNEDRHYFNWIDTYSIPKNFERIKINIPMNRASISQIFLYYFASSMSTIHADGASERIDDEKLKTIFKEMPYNQALDYCSKQCPIEIQQKYPGNHMNWWNKEKTIRMLKKAGFKDIYSSGYGQSYNRILRDTSKFDNTNPKMSFYIESVK